jgi:hypothetical protein
MSEQKLTSPSKYDSLNSGKLNQVKTAGGGSTYQRGNYQKDPRDDLFANQYSYGKRPTPSG